MALPLVVSAGLSISPPFNAVWVVALGLFSVRSRRFGCFLALCAFAVCLLITSQQGKIYLQSVGSSAPIANVSEPGGIRRYLQFCLARWMSTVLFSAFVLRAVYRVLPFPRVGCYIRVAFLALLLYIIYTSRRRRDEHPELRLHRLGRTLLFAVLAIVGECPSCRSRFVCIATCNTIRKHWYEYKYCL